ncbi:HEXXH motif-containing putative peptide modification protein [Legionella pneumophila serogroup 1]
MSANSLLSTSIPDEEGAKKLIIYAAEKQKNDLLDLLKNCEKKLRYDLNDLAEFIQEIDCSRKLSPAFFLYTQELRDAIKSTSIDKIMDAIQHVSWLKTYGIYEQELRISSVLSEFWETSYISKMRQYEQKNICGETTLVRPVSSKQLEFHASNIRKAIDLINTGDMDVAHEISILISSIKLFQGRVLRGQASGDTMGAVWLRIPDPHDDQVGYWIEHIVHEVSHLRLHAMFFQEKFILNPDDEYKFRAPIRDDLRPMLGVFHATFVLARMIRVFKKLSFKGYASRFRDRLQLCQLQFEIGLNSVYSKDAELTDNGKLIRESFKECALILEN